MSMRWEDERYVRLYTRDTVTWKMLPWQSKAMIGPIMRKLDRAGVLSLDGEGMEGIAALTEMPVEVVGPGVDGLVKRGVMLLTPDALVMPNFLAAQETKQSDKARKQKERETARDLARAKTLGIETSVTERDEQSRNVTERPQEAESGHAASRDVTPSCAVPCSAVPSQTSLPSEESATRPPAPFELKGEPEPKKRKRSEAQQFRDWAEGERTRVTGLIEGPDPDPQRLNAWFKRALAEAGTVERLASAFGRYVLHPVDDYWRARGFPLAGFMSDNVWRQYAPPKEAGNAARTA